MTIIPIAYYTDSTCYFERIRHLYRPVLLDSAIAPDDTTIHQRFSRYDIMSACPQTTITLQNDQHILENIQYNALAECIQTHTSARPQGKACFNSLQTALFSQTTEHVTPLCNHEIPFHGGAIGYFSYDLGKHLEKVTATTLTQDTVPDMAIGIYHWALICDHHEKTCYLVLRETCDTDIVDNILPLIQTDTSKASTQQTHFTLTTPFTSNLTLQTYADKFDKVKAYIQAGDCYQINLSQQFTASCQGDSWHAYTYLRNTLHTPFSAYLAWGDFTILSLSPERFLETKQLTASTRPIKGTRPRGHTCESDTANKKALKNSVKDKAENVMIVDLLRHDLSKNCDNVHVPELFKIESYHNVHHLVSCIEGTLKPNSNSINLLADAFPGGSITGAPKIRAMQIINEVEPHTRTIYCGTIGYIDFNGNMDTNIAIRTLLIKDQEIKCWGGGGIVADSTCEEEYQESIDKIKHMTQGLEKNFLRQSKHS